LVAIEWLLRSRWSIPPVDPDQALREAAIQAADTLATAYDQIVPRSILLQGFEHQGERVSFGSFQRGIHRARQQRGPAALTLMTAPPKPGRPAPYDDVLDLDSGSILYHYRAGSADQADNRALRAAHELQAPLIYFSGIGAGQYQVVTPIFVTEDDPEERIVLLEVGLRHADLQGRGIVSSEDARRYRFSEVRQRYHQARFRRDVLHAYANRCAVCSLREPLLVEASHIVRDTHPEGIAAVINGIALCAIHHVAYDRNLVGIDPSGVVHIASRVLSETDGPMLEAGIQGFHGAAILQPRRPEYRPDPDRLAIRFDEFEAAA
jgi:putative restriction endonuclease